VAGHFIYHTMVWKNIIIGSMAVGALYLLG
jgi:hypothetical protein